MLVLVYLESGLGNLKFDWWVLGRSQRSAFLCHELQDEVGLPSTDDPSWDKIFSILAVIPRLFLWDEVL